MKRGVIYSFSLAALHFLSSSNLALSGLYYGLLSYSAVLQFESQDVLRLSWCSCDLWSALGTDQDHSQVKDFWHKKVAFKKMSFCWERMQKTCFPQEGKFKKHCLLDIKWVLTYEQKEFSEVSLFLKALAANFDALKALFSFHVNSFLILVVNRIDWQNAFLALKHKKSTNCQRGKLSFFHSPSAAGRWRVTYSNRRLGKKCTLL